MTTGTELRDRQLIRCCDALAAVSPDARTLCAGWTAHDLAIHLWLIKHDPLSWPGVVLSSLAGLTAGRAVQVRRRWSYVGLVERLRKDGGSIACMPLDFAGGHRHALGEFFVHTQDVARPAGLRQPEPDDQLQEALWLRTGAAARALRRRLPRGLLLVEPGGRTHQVDRAPIELVVTGPPSELICWVYGRRAVAEVTMARA